MAKSFVGCCAPKFEVGQLARALVAHWCADPIIYEGRIAECVPDDSKVAPAADGFRYRLEGHAPLFRESVLEVLEDELEPC